MAETTVNGEIHKRFENYLKEQGLKLTRQRATILDAFLCMDSHVSAEDLYHEVLHHDGSIGQATVFRTMKLLAESGIATEMTAQGRTLRYENAHGSKHHDHIQCIACAAVFEFHSEAIEALQVQICKSYGVELVSHRLNLFGYCQLCQDKRSGIKHQGVK